MTAKNIGSRTSGTPKIELRVAGEKRSIAFKYRKFHWTSFVNGGYQIKATVDDSWWHTISRLATNSVLEKARREPTPIEFRIKWNDNDATTLRTAYMTEASLSGNGNGGLITFVGIDPPSFWLNSGDASGKVFKGRVSSVIEQVIQQYAPRIDYEITKTNDSDQNYWPMMRQDPKTFIQSMLDWSSSITAEKTNWIVASRDTKIIIKTQAELESEDYGIFTVNTGKEAVDVMDIKMLSNSIIAPLQTQLVTAGISESTGQLFDLASDIKEDTVFVKDENTTSKKNAGKLTSKLAFLKPEGAGPGENGGRTFIRAIPEIQDLGVRYKNYIDGRARNFFMNMLNTVMRIRITIHGHPQFDDPEKLGVSFLRLLWKDSEGSPYFLSGQWLIYGFHHEVSQYMWKTHLYLSRLDANALAKEVK